MRLGVPADRKSFLLAGDVGGRKGVSKVLEFVACLTPEESKQICLAIVGRAEASSNKDWPKVEAVGRVDVGLQSLASGIR